MRKIASALLVSAAVCATGSALAHDGDACGQGDRFEEFSGPLRELAKRRIEWVSSLFKRNAPPPAYNSWASTTSTDSSRLGAASSNRPVGGAAVMASYLRDEQARFVGDTFDRPCRRSCGRLATRVSPVQDEPSISFLNLLGNRQCTRLASSTRCATSWEPSVTTSSTKVSRELKRMILGGNHAAGPFLEPKWQGARFPYVSSNVIDDESGDTLLKPTSSSWSAACSVGVIGAVLEATPTVVTPEGVEGVTFVDEAVAINKQVQKLRKLGVETIVVTIHQGGSQESYSGPTSGCCRARRRDRQDREPPGQRCGRGDLGACS